MRLASLLLLVAVLSLSSSKLTAWEQISKNIYFEQSGSYVTAGEAQGYWMGLQLKPDRTSIQLVAVSDFIYSNGDIREGLIRNTETGAISPITFSLTEVWQSVSDDPTVVAVVPVGYLIQEGVPRLAGYLEVSGRELEPLFNAPQLTAIYCVSSRAFMEAVEFVDFTWQVPYLFAIDFPNEASRFRAADLEKALVFDLEEDKADQPAYFSSCKNQVQIGPRIIEPRGIGAEDNPQNRLSNDIFRFDGGRPTRRTVITWARNNWLSLISTSEATSLKSLGETISSPVFYASTSPTCGAGRSLSCEFWAAVATSYEHSGMIVRTPGGRVHRVGETNSTIGAALIIRSR